MLAISVPFWLNILVLSCFGLIIWFWCYQIIFRVVLGLPSHSYNFLFLLCCLVLLYKFLLWLAWFSVSRHQFGYALWKINLNSPIINQNIIHFQIRLFTGSRCLKLNKRILKTLTSLPIPNNLNTFDRSKSWEYNL